MLIERSIHDDQLTGSTVTLSAGIESFNSPVNTGVMGLLLNKIEKIDFEVRANLQPGQRLTQRHFIVPTIEQLLDTAIVNGYGLCEQNGFIYMYNGQYWEHIEDRQFKTFLGDIALRSGVEKTNAHYFEFQEKLYKQFCASGNLNRSERRSDEVLINLRNGTLEVSTEGWGLRGFRRIDFLTYQLPFDYIPGASCPIFQRYLNRVLPDTESQMVLAEFMGYVFTKHLKLEKCLLLHGSGANGKSVFFEVMNALLGRENISNLSLAQLAKPEGRPLIGNKLLNYGSEINANMQPDLFKQLASGEPIQAKRLYCDPYIMYDYAKLCFNSNTLPKEVENSSAYFRRFLIIPFNVTIPESERNPELANEIIRSELPGVINWILEGLQRLLSQSGFSLCKASEEALNAYRLDMDSVASFLTEMKYRKSDTGRIPPGTLYREYAIFCDDEGYKCYPKRDFYKALKEKNIGKVKIRGYDQLCLVKSE